MRMRKKLLSAAILVTCCFSIANAQVVFPAYVIDPQHESPELSLKTFGSKSSKPSFPSANKLLKFPEIRAEIGVQDYQQAAWEQGKEDGDKVFVDRIADLHRQHEEGQIGHKEVGRSTRAIGVDLNQSRKELVRESLLPFQQRRLAELQRQILMKTTGLSGFLNHESVKDKLRVSEEQLKKIETVESQYSEKSDEAHLDAWTNFEEELLQVLSPSENKRYREIFGAPFDLQKYEAEKSRKLKVIRTELRVGTADNGLETVVKMRPMVHFIQSNRKISSLANVSVLLGSKAICDELRISTEQQKALREIEAGLTEKCATALKSWISQYENTSLEVPSKTIENANVFSEGLNTTLIEKVMFEVLSSSQCDRLRQLKAQVIAHYTPEFGFFESKQFVEAIALHSPERVKKLVLQQRDELKLQIVAIRDQQFAEAVEILSESQRATLEVMLGEDFAIR